MPGSHVNIAPSSSTMALSDVLERTVAISWDGGHLGSGIVIEPRWVLSAAHLYTTPTNGHCSPICITQRDGTCVQGTWWYSWEDLDLAIAYLGTPIGEETIPLEPRDVSVDMTGVIVGYGKTSTEPDVRDVKVVAQEPYVSVEIVDQTMTKKISYGDSGGPFFISRDGMLQLVGIVSHLPRYSLRWFLHGIARRFHLFRDYGERTVVCARVDLEGAKIKSAIGARRMPCHHPLYRRIRMKLARLREKIGI